MGGSSDEVRERTGAVSSEAAEFRVHRSKLYNRSGPIKWVLSHLLQYPLLPIGMIVTSVVNNFAFSYIQIFVGEGFDRILSAGWARRDLIVLALSIGAAAVIQGLSGLIRNLAVELLGQKIERNSRDELYADLLGKSQSFHGGQRIGDIMARVTNDVRMLNLMFSPGVMLIEDAVLALIVPLILIGRMESRLLLVPCVFIGLLIITVYDYNRRLKPVSISQQDQFGVMNAGLTDAINGIEVVKANVREHYEWQKFTGNAGKFRDYFVKQGRIQAFYLPMLAFSICWAIAFLHALLLWRTGGITLGQVIAFMGLMNTFRFPTFISIFSFNLVQLGIASANRILRILNIKTKLDENTGGISGRIEGRVSFDSVSFGYSGNRVLHNLSFVAEPGQTLAIVGQTGSGKSTLTRLVNRIFDADAGEVKIDGHDVRDWSLDALRSQISIIEQDVFLYSRSIAANIAFGRADASRQEIIEAAKLAQADEFIRDFENGYDTEIGEWGVTLSGGQRQRVAIARAFLTDPRILILDDSTSAIDSETEDRIQQAMRAISSSRTTFLITHRLSQIRWADRILVLKRGQIIDQGNHGELIRDCPEYERIFSQYR